MVEIKAAVLDSGSAACKPEQVITGISSGPSGFKEASGAAGIGGHIVQPRQSLRSLKIPYDHQIHHISQQLWTRRLRPGSSFFW